MGWGKKNKRKKKISWEPSEPLERKERLFDSCSFHSSSFMRVCSHKILTDIRIVKLDKKNFFQLTAGKVKKEVMYPSCLMCGKKGKSETTVSVVEHSIPIFYFAGISLAIGLEGEKIYFQSGNKKNEFLLTNEAKEQFQALYVTGEEK